MSLEFVIVFTGLLVVLAAVTMPMYNRSHNDSEKFNKITETREAANALADALNTVYAAGPGSRVTIEYWLPSGVLEIKIGGYENLNIDGIQTTDENVHINGRTDVQIKMDFNGDGIWDNKREAVIILDAILPSRWNENAVDRGNSWVRENCVHVEEKNFKVGSFYGTNSKRTFHRTTLTYQYDLSQFYPRKILVSDEITGVA